MGQNHTSLLTTAARTRKTLGRRLEGEELWSLVLQSVVLHRHRVFS